MDGIQKAFYSCGYLHRFGTCQLKLQRIQFTWQSCEKANKIKRLTTKGILTELKKRHPFEIEIL